MKRVLHENFGGRQRIGARVTFNHLETKVVTSSPETLSFFTQCKKVYQLNIDVFVVLRV